MDDEHLENLIAAIGDEALAALSGTSEEMKKALGNIHAMARYRFDVVADRDRLRNRA